MRKRELTTIDLFIASGEETKSIRDGLVKELKKLSVQHENSGFDFQVQWWEDDSAKVPKTGRSQDEYDKLIDKSDMVAVIIKNRLGKYTMGEFKYAIDLFKSNGQSPAVVVYTLPSNDDNEVRFSFIQSLRSEDSDYFHRKVENEHELYKEVIYELLRIKDKYSKEQEQSIASVQETVSRLHIGGELTDKAVELFNNGEYSKAILSLDLEKIRERKHELSSAQKEVADAFVLRAKLELTNVKNRERFTTVEGLFEEALEASRSAEALFEYAYYLQMQNKHEKAIRLYIEALTLCRKLATDNPDMYNPNVAVTLNNLASLHRKTSEYKKAKDGHTEALALYRKLAAGNPDAYNPYVAATLNNLANLHCNINEYKRAEAEYTDALVLYRKFASDNPATYNPDVAMTLNNLANLHSDISEYKNAETEYAEALVLYRELASDNHDAYNPDVAMTLNNLANLHNDIHEYKKAEDEFTEALDIRRELAVDNPNAYNPYVANTLNNLAVLHRNTGEYKKAEDEYTEALALYRKLAAYSPDAYNPDVARTLNNLAILHYDTSEYKKAEAEFTEALDIRRKLTADNPNVYNPNVAITLKNLAILHLNTNKYKKAEAEFTEALELITPFYETYPSAYQSLYNKIIQGQQDLHNHQN